MLYTTNMKQQVVAIHGADAFATYEEFFQSLGDKLMHLDRLRFSDWKQTLHTALGDDFDVLLPRMPNPQNAKYAEWKVWFSKLAPELDDGVLLVGHSMGGVFLAKYLSEEIFPKQVRGTFLVAAPYNEDGGRRLVEFAVEHDLGRFREQAGRIFLYHSENDPVVAFSELKKFTDELPDATVRTFTDREHFNQSEFPELVADIRSLA